MSCQPPTRSTLIAKLRDPRDYEAWAQFVGIYEPLILRFAVRHGLQQADAEDACQQVLAAVARDVENWRSDGKEASFRRWLFRIAKNRVLKLLEKQALQPKAAGGPLVSNSIAGLSDDRTTLSDRFEHEYRQQLMLKSAALVREEFKATTWQAFWQTCIEGRDLSEVAKELQMSVGNVYVARSRIIRRIRQTVKSIEGT